jgi:hypothetical protein
MQYRAGHRLRHISEPVIAPGITAPGRSASGCALTAPPHPELDLLRARGDHSLPLLARADSAFSVPDAWLRREPDVSPSVTATVQPGAVPLISWRAALPVQLWLGPRFLSEGSLARPSLTVIPPTRLSRSAARHRVQLRPASRPPGGGASAAAGASSWAWPRPVHLARSRRTAEVRALSPHGIPRSGRHGPCSGQCLRPHGADSAAVAPSTKAYTAPELGHMRRPPYRDT